MTANSKIEWTDHTFNPWIGCTKVGPGCDHCYAEAMMDRRMHKVQWGAGQPRVRTSAANWRQPLRWNAQAAREGRRFRVFCASLADVFDNEVPAGWRADLFALIRSTPNLDWLLLTKRIGNAHTMMVMAGAYVMYVRPYSDPEPSERWRIEQPLPNVWLGATVVNQEEADRDIPKLLATPAAMRFLSIEPMLGPIHVGPYLSRSNMPGLRLMPGFVDPLPGINWVICGGESGPKARPMHPDWARALRDQCVAAGVSFFFKQWGAWTPGENVERSTGVVDGSCFVDGQWMPSRENLAQTDGHRDDEPDLYRVGKKAAGRLLDGRTWDEVPRP